ncbi:MAG: phosphonate C-P lyase system protein PhnL [Ectothiorhodospiraceae bacterium]
MTQTMLTVRDLHKGFTLHLREGLQLPVLAGVSLAVRAGECLALTGPSGTGKSTLLRCLYGNYRAQAGSIQVRHRGERLDLARASAREVLAVRRETLGYISQFLRAVPRVATLDLVAEPLVVRGIRPVDARARAADMLTRLHLPQALWSVPPDTFSGGEQQRVNVARGLIGGFPILLLDEPTASLDPDNKAAVLACVQEAKQSGTAVIGIFHDTDAREALCDRAYDMTAARPAVCVG